MRTNLDSERKSTQAATRNQENVMLIELVQTHYTVTADGEVAFECRCQNPGQCSILQHHPDADALLVELVESVGVSYFESDPVQRKQLDYYLCRLCESLIILFALFCILQDPSWLGMLGFLATAYIFHMFLFPAIIDQMVAIRKTD
jgi:hypothetical protein